MRQFNVIRIGAGITPHDPISAELATSLSHFASDLAQCFHHQSSCFWYYNQEIPRARIRILQAALFEEKRAYLDYILLANRPEFLNLELVRKMVRIAEDEYSNIVLSEKRDEAETGKQVYDFLLAPADCLRKFAETFPPDAWPDHIFPDSVFLNSLSETGFSIHRTSDFSDSYEKPAWLRPYQLPREVCFFPTVPVTNRNADSRLALRLSDALKAIAEIHPTDRLLVYGAGTLAQAIVPLIQQNVSLVADQNEELHGRQWMGMTVRNPEELPGFLNDFDTILITPLGRETEIIGNLRRIMGDSVKELKIITLDSGVTQGRSLDTNKVNFVLRNAPHSETRKVNFALRNSRELTRRGVLYVGYVCNIRCVFCYYAYKPAKKWHPLEECKQDATLYRTLYGNEQVDITGGEPTIYPHILGLAEHCREIGLRPSLITNAIALANMEKLMELKAHGVYDFLCSVHGLGDVYESITNRQGLWSKLTRAMGNLDKAEMKWRANCTMTAINKHQLKEIAEFVFQNGAGIINFISYNPFYEWAAKTDIDFQARHSEIAPYLAEALEYCDEAGLEANVRYYPFCLIKGHEEKCYNYSQLSYDPHEWDFCSWFSEKTKNPSSKMPYYFKQIADNKEELHLFFAQKTKHVSYFRNQICAGCSMGFLCDGFTNQYAGRFGIGEMRPYTGDYITDPTHFIIRQRKIND